jgi:competence protein ComEC
MTSEGPPAGGPSSRPDRNFCDPAHRDPPPFCHLPCALAAPAWARPPDARLAAVVPVPPVLVFPACGFLAGVAIGATVAPPVLPLVPVVACASGASLLAFGLGRPRVFLALVAAGFTATGLLLGARAGAAMLDPPLRGALADVLRASGRDAPVVVLEGRLRHDAAPTAYGAGFTLDVVRVTVAGEAREVGGGVRVSVGGDVPAEAIRAWRAGRRVRLPGAVRRALPYLNPGVPDQEAMLARRGIALLASVKSARLVEVIGAATPVEEAAASVRWFVRDRLREAVGRLSARSAAISAAILIGDRAGLDPDTELWLQRAGTFHVIAISGGNVAILTGLVLAVLAVSGMGPRAASLAATAIVVAFAWIVEGGGSVARATLMAAIYLTGRALDQRALAVNVIAATALLLVAWSPAGVFDAGLALTFGATLGIVVGVPPACERALARVPERWRQGRRGAAARAVVSLGAATVCAELVVFPIAAWVFSRVTAAGLALNFLAVPLMTAVQVGSLATVAAGTMGAGAGALVAWVPHLAAEWLVESAALVRWAPWSTTRVPPPPGWLLLGYYGALLGAMATAGLARRTCAATTGLAGVLIVVAPVWPAVESVAGLFRPERIDAAPRVRWPAALRVALLDVGQGDAAVVQFPGGVSMMVDAGGLPGASRFDLGARIVTPAAWALGVRRLSVLSISHGHPDHAAGAVSVIDDLRPREVWDGVGVPGHPLMAVLREKARGAGARWREVRRGDVREYGGVRVGVLHPGEPDWERRTIRNDDSVVLEITTGAAAIVLPGDIGRAVEPAIAPLLSALPLTVVGVPHHGSAASSTDTWVRAARPLAAVVSAGRGNRFGHPAPAVLERYREAGALVLRTDVEGAIIVETDGTSLLVRTADGVRAGWRVGGRGGDVELRVRE